MGFESNVLGKYKSFTYSSCFFVRDMMFVLLTQLEAQFVLIKVEQNIKKKTKKSCYRHPIRKQSWRLKRVNPFKIKHFCL